MNTIACIKWGNKYSAEYVNILYAMVKRNLTIPFTFVCFTDDPQGISQSITVHPLPELHCSSQLPSGGGWRKLAIFTKGSNILQGKVVFLDLDLVIVGNLDEFFYMKVILSLSMIGGAKAAASAIHRFSASTQANIPT